MRLLACLGVLPFLACAAAPPRETAEPSKYELGLALADAEGLNTFCAFNPEGCVGAEAPASQDAEECKAACWANYDHNKQYCEELRGDPAAYRRCMVAAGLLLSGCLATCEALSSREADMVRKAER
jgi:hypothetical protein